MLLRVIAAATAILVGCGGIAHLSTSPILFEAAAAAIDRPAEIIVFQAYNGRHFRGKDSLSILLGLEEHPQRKVVKPSANGVFRVDFTSFKRGDVFWVIPPFFGLFIDHGSYLLIRLDGGAVYGFSIDDGLLKQAYRLGPRNRLVEIQQNELPFVVETQAAIQEVGTLEIRLKPQSHAVTPTSGQREIPLGARSRRPMTPIRPPGINQLDLCRKHRCVPAKVPKAR